MGYKGDYTTQLCTDYIKPLIGSLITKQDSMESNKGFFRGSDKHLANFFSFKEALMMLAIALHDLRSPCW